MGFLGGNGVVAIAALEEIVSVEAAIPEPGVMLAGENEQLIVLGIPVQLSVIELLNDPDCGFAVTVRLPAVPADIVRDAGDALKESVGFGVGVGVGGGAGEGGGGGAVQVAV